MIQAVARNVMVRAATPEDITDDMVERAARALNAEADRQLGHSFGWDALTERARDGSRLCARAALTAAFASTQQEAQRP